VFSKNFATEPKVALMSAKAKATVRNGTKPARKVAFIKFSVKKKGALTGANISPSNTKAGCTGSIIPVTS
jgi:hypothetical protein